MYKPGRPSGQGTCVKKEPMDIECGDILLSYHTPYTQVKHEPNERSGSALLQDEGYLETKAATEAIPTSEGCSYLVRDYNSGSSLSEFKLQNKAHPQLFLDHFLSPQHSTDVQLDNTHEMYNKWRKGRKGPRKVPRFIHEIAEQTRELVERRLRHCGDEQLYSENLLPLHCNTTTNAPQTVKFKLAQKLDDKAQRKVPRQEDLPYMGQITLQGRPRRGRKPKKADICHMISKNYGISFDQPSMPKEKFPSSAGHVPPARGEQMEPLDLCTKNRGEVDTTQHSSPTPFNEMSWPQPHFLSSPVSPLTTNVSAEVLNKSIEAAKLMNIDNCLIPTHRAIPPTPAQSAQVSICKFKFTGGARPSLERKRMLSVDSIGNFRLHGNIKTDSPNPSSSGLTSSSARSATPASRITSRAQGKRRRKSRKSLMREKLEKTFKEKGFLIQTQQFEAPQGATFCKFRQLRKFTRYLFRSWKDYLPNNINSKTQPGQQNHSETNT